MQQLRASSRTGRRLSPGILIPLAATLLGGPASAVQGSTCYPFPTNSTDWAGYNRGTMLCMGGACPAPADPELGLFDIDNPFRKISHRFTNQVPKTVRSVWLFIHDVVGSPGTLRVTVADDVDGQPVLAPVLSSTVFSLSSGFSGWVEVDLPIGGFKALLACQTYHVLIEAEGTPFNADNEVRFAAAINRFPMPYQPLGQESNGYESFFDPELAFMYDDAGGSGFIAQWEDGTIVQWDSNIMYAPVFQLECTDNTLLGQSYDDHVEQTVTGQIHWGQSFVVDPTLPAGFAVNFVAVFVANRRSGQSDHLWGYLYDPATSSIVPGSDVEIVKQPATVSGGRAHWFGASFPQAIPLTPGKEYYLVQRSDNTGDQPRGFIFPTERSTAPIGVLADATYGPESAKLVLSADGGGTFLQLAEESDAGFMLGALAEPIGAVGVFDEGGVFRVNDGLPAHTVSPGDQVQVEVRSRNMGPGVGTLFIDVLDASTGLSELPQPAEIDGVPANRDALSIPTILLDAPSATGTWRLDIVVGHKLSDTEFVPDDVVRFEIRVF